MTLLKPKKAWVENTFSSCELCEAEGIRDVWVTLYHSSSSALRDPPRSPYLRKAAKDLDTCVHIKRPCISLSRTVKKNRLRRQTAQASPDGSPGTTFPYKQWLTKHMTLEVKFRIFLLHQNTALKISSIMPVVTYAICSLLSSLCWANPTRVLSQKKLYFTSGKKVVNEEKGL